MKAKMPRPPAPAQQPPPPAEAPKPPTHFLVPAADMQQVGAILSNAPYMFAKPVIEILDRAAGVTVTQAPPPGERVNVAGKIVDNPLAPANGPGVQS